MLAQLQTQQGGGSLPQHIKLQLPIQIQQTGASSTQGGQVKHLIIVFIVHEYDPASITGLEKQKCSELMVQDNWLKTCRLKDFLCFRHRWATSWPSRQLLSRSSCKGSNSSENSNSRRRNWRQKPRESKPSMQPARTTSFRNKCVLYQAEPFHLFLIAHAETQQISVIFIAV